MLFQEICHGLGLVKFSFSQRRSAIEIGGVYVGAVRDKQFRDGSLVCVCSSMQRRRAPVVVLVMRVNIGAQTYQ